MVVTFGGVKQMPDEIIVNVVKRKGQNLFLRYTDPVDGKRREKNSGTTNMKAAQRAAGEWQAELRLALRRRSKPNGACLLKPMNRQ